MQNKLILKENTKISGTVYTRTLNNDYKKSLSGLSSIVFLFIGCASLLSFMVLVNLNWGKKKRTCNI